MKNKILIGIIVVLVVIGGIEVILTMNKSDNSEISQATEENENKAEDIYYLKIGDKEIKLGEEFSKEKFGEENEYSEIQSCAFEGLDKTYKYTDYEITTFPEGEKDKIYSIYFLSQELETTEGVKLAETKEKMIETYGEEYENSGNQYTYTKGKTSIDFIIENDVITSIQYTYVTE